MKAAVKQLPAVQPQPVAGDSAGLMAMINRAATDPAFDVAKLESLLAVKERWEATEARKAFVVAMAQFKSDPPSILKSKAVDIPGGAKFSHATLANVCDGVIASLSKYGLSHKWEVQQVEKAITVTCVLTHLLGHQERTTLVGLPDDSGKKNAIQQMASTVTYLERYTLLAATGLAAKDQDNDGAGGDHVEGLPEGTLVDHLSAIDAASDIKSLQVAFAAAWTAAGNLKDKASQRRFTEAKDKRKAALGAKS